MLKEVKADAALKERLAAARAQREELQAEREARAEAAELEREVRDAELAVQGELAIQRAEEKHGRLDEAIKAVHSAKGQGVIIVRTPTAAAFRRFQDTSEGGLKTAVMSSFVRPFVVHPDHATYDAMLDAEPALLTHVTGAVCELAGFRAERVSGK